MTADRIKAERAPQARGMTLLELQKFLDRAFVAGFPPEAIPKVTAGFRLGLHTIEIEGEVTPP